MIITEVGIGLDLPPALGLKSRIKNCSNKRNGIIQRRDINSLTWRSQYWLWKQSDFWVIGLLSDHENERRPTILSGTFNVSKKTHLCCVKTANLRVICEERILQPTLADIGVPLGLEPKQSISSVHVLNNYVMLPLKYEVLPLPLKSLQPGGEMGTNRGRSQIRMLNFLTPDGFRKWTAQSKWTGSSADGKIRVAKCFGPSPLGSEDQKPTSISLGQKRNLVLGYKVLGIKSRGIITELPVS